MVSGQLLPASAWLCRYIKAARATWAPVREETRVLHFGLWGSEEQGGRNTPSVDIGAAYAGRGPGDDDGFVFDALAHGLDQG